VKALDREEKIVKLKVSDIFIEEGEQLVFAIGSFHLPIKENDGIMSTFDTTACFGNVRDHALSLMFPHPACISMSQNSNSPHRQQKQWLLHRFEKGAVPPEDPFGLMRVGRQIPGIYCDSKAMPLQENSGRDSNSPASRYHALSRPGLQSLFDRELRRSP
jgi:hypothetical protein